MITPDELRSRYLAFFEERGHRVVPSSPVIPEGDPTLLFTNAGMNQFKDVLLGREKRDYTRAVDVQKCIRAGGKHNDLDEVGRDGRHLTFFEMLGNWSFGDYYKKETIQWAWDFVTKGIGLEPERLYVSVYLDDDEAWDIWHDDVGLPADRIVRLGNLAEGDDENFWSMGPTGPCGPCTEMYYDHHPELGPVKWEPGFDEERFVEIWNLVFMEFDRSEDGTMNPLPMKSVDTGMGLDRVAAVLAGVDNVFHTGLFTPILARLEALRTGEKFSEERVSGLYDDAEFTARCVIADHIRTLTFSICDGGTFSNEGRGYVLRRILRRAVRHGRNLGFDAPFLHQVVPAVVQTFSHVYPELRLKGTEAAKIIEQEEARFFRTLDRGIALFDEVATKAAEAGNGQIPGDAVFKLYDTFGFPVDLTTIMAEERDLSVDLEGYEREMQAQRERSRAADDRYVDAGEWVAVREGVADTFVGYDQLTAVTEVLRYRRIVDTDIVEVCLRETPFYAESGGQVGDRGTLHFEGTQLELEVIDTQKTTAGLTHRCQLIDGDLDAHIRAKVIAEVDARHRFLTACNHTATHLLHAALHEHVSDSAFQAGSLVAPDRLRFDFNFERPVTREELRAIENSVNAAIRKGQKLEIREDVLLADAEAMGAMMIFGEKYGERVRVIDIADTSVELCGGTHVANTGDIAWFRITSESGIAAGVRRIEAVTNEGAFALAAQERDRLEAAATMLKTTPANLEERLQRLLAERHELEKRVAELTRAQSRQVSGDLASSATDIDGLKVVSSKVAVADRDGLLEVADRLRDKLGDKGVALLASVIDDKPALVVIVADAVFKARKLKAGDLVNAVAIHVDGRGGGRPTLAQAGGKNTDGLDAAVEAFPQALRDAIGA